MLDQLDLSPPTVLQVIREQSAHTRLPRLTPHDLAGLLGRAGVPRFADEIRRLIPGTRIYEALPETPGTGS